MSSGFVTEAEIDEKRRLRQEEWEKVRQADQPEEAPEEPFDHRSLFDRLEEQKQKKQLDYEEAHKLKNMIKGLDDDEVEFLDFVDRKKIEAEQLKEREEKKELLEFRKHVEKLKENSLDERIQAEIRTVKPPSGNTNSIRSQQKLLQGIVVKRKSNEVNNDVATNGGPSAPKRALQDTSSPAKVSDGSGEGASESRKRMREEEDKESLQGLTCVGILPGLGHYAESSDSDSSSSLDEPDHTRPKYDLVGRKLVYQTQEEQKQTRRQ